MNVTKFGLSYVNLFLISLVEDPLNVVGLERMKLKKNYVSKTDFVHLQTCQHQISEQTVVSPIFSTVKKLSTIKT